jgi:hypothetical protein
MIALRGGDKNAMFEYLCVCERERESERESERVRERGNKRKQKTNKRKNKRKRKGRKQFFFYGFFPTATAAFIVYHYEHIGFPGGPVHRISF